MYPPRLSLVAAVLLFSAGFAAPARGAERLAIKDDVSTMAGGEAPDDVLRLIRPVGRDLLFDAQVHPAAAGLRQRLAPLIEAWLKAHAPQRQFRRPLFIRGDRYRLVGQSGSALYRLEIEATISRKPDSFASTVLRVESFRCALDGPAERHALDEWLADGSAQLRAADRRFLDGCARRAEQDLAPLLAP